MNEKVMVVTGAFATHTTKLYNYYVCPSSWDIVDLKYIAVVYFGELKYIGKIRNVISWSFNQPSRTFTGLNGNNLIQQIKNDLHKFEAVLNFGDHYLFELIPILNNCSSEQNMRYQGNGSFTRSHRYFESLGGFFEAFQNITSEEQSEEPINSSSVNDGLENTSV
jgi:hypothetical protein